MSAKKNQKIDRKSASAELLAHAQAGHLTLQIGFAPNSDRITVNAVRPDTATGGLWAQQNILAPKG